jgi:glutathione S-transferase
MLERAACTISQIAPSEEQFWRKVHDDEEGWQLRPLADKCRRAGKALEDGQCYAFTTPPILGGEYTEANVWVAPWLEWFAFTADLFQQIKDLPDGTPVSLRVTD